MTETPRWRDVPLRRVIVSAQAGFASGARDQSGVIQIRMNNVTTDGSLDWTRFIRVPVSPKHLAKYSLQPGDVLFNATNSPELVGKTAAFAGHTEPVVFSNHFVRLRGDGQRLDSSYLARWLTHQQQQGVFQGICTQWVNQASVRKDDLLSLIIPLPPLPEQKRIAAILAKADRLRRLRRFARDLSDTYLQSVFLEMFGDPGTNPMGWEVRLLSSISESITYGITASAQARPVGPKFLRITDIQNGRVDWGRVPYCLASKSDAREASLLNGDIVFARTGATTGKSFLVQSCPVNAVFASYLIRVRPTPKVEPAYLAAFFQSRAYWSQIKQSASGSAQPGVNATKLKGIRLVVPPVALQRRFSRIVLHYGQLRAQQREAERLAEHLFQTLLHGAFRGEM